jgi:hypothetical protein
MTYTGKTKNSTSFSNKLKGDITAYLWNILNSPWLEAYDPWLDDTTTISTTYTLKSKS